VSRSAAKTKWLFQAQKAGHAGTLDPLATGLLILCTGKMTKQIESFQAKQTEKRNSLFEELDKKLKENIEKRTTKKNW